jgi:DNA-binding NarL/FixJ family response regulator
VIDGISRHGYTVFMTQPFASIQGAGGETEALSGGLHDPTSPPEGGLVEAALHADEGGATAPLAWLWRDLIAGATVAVHPFYRGDRAYLVLEDVVVDRRSKVCSGRNLELFRRAIGGQMQKAIAYDLELANSTVASVVSRCLRAMGFCCTGLRVPMMLAMSAHADACASAQRARSNEFPFGKARYRVVSVERPDVGTVLGLSEAEREVVRVALEGLSALEIAARKRKSVHTVTNQLASSFHKLGVGSRGSLLWHMVSKKHEARSSLGGAGVER